MRAVLPLLLSLLASSGCLAQLDDPSHRRGTASFPEGMHYVLEIEAPDGARVSYSVRTTIGPGVKMLLLSESAYSAYFVGAYTMPTCSNQGRDFSGACAISSGTWSFVLERSTARSNGPYVDVGGHTQAEYEITLS